MITTLCHCLVCYSAQYRECSSFVSR